MDRPPELSVLVAAYNAARYLTDAIQSVLRQPATSFELIIVNDGSEDGTGSILDSYSKVVRIFHQPNRGAAAARNLACSESLGEFILILDADDRVSPNSFYNRICFLRDNPSVDLVYGDTMKVNEFGHDLGLVKLDFKLTAMDDAYPALALANLFPVHAAVTRRSVFQSLGQLHDEDIDLVGDWDLWARVAANHRMAYLPAVVAEYRHHPQMSLRNLSRRRGLTQTYNTVRRIIDRPAFPRVPRRIQGKCFARYATLAAQLGYWQQVRQATTRGLRTYPYHLGLWLLFLAARCGANGSYLQRWIQRRWG